MNSHFQKGNRMDSRINKAEVHAYLEASRFLKELPSETIQIYQADLEKLHSALQQDGVHFLRPHTDTLIGLRRALLEFDSKHSS